MILIKEKYSPMLLSPSSILLIAFVIAVLLLIVSYNDKVENFENTADAANIAWDAEPVIVSDANHNYNFAVKPSSRQNLFGKAWIVNPLKREARPKWFRV